MQPTSIRLSIPDSIDPTRLMGPADANLRRVEAAFKALVSVRGNQVLVSGSAEQVDLVTQVFSRLIRLVEAGECPQASDVDLLVDQVCHGAQRADLLSDDILLTYRGRALRPKTAGQKRYIDAIRRSTITFGIGPAGTGKTYLAMAMAVAALKRKEVGRIVLTRPVVEAGESLGFLPGTLQEKLDPYVRPLYDALFDMTDMERGNALIEQGVIEIAPLAFMRGRTLNDAFVILDEAQNTTDKQMKMFLTRLGFGSRMVVTGDLGQVDLPRGVASGLREASQVLKDVKGIGIVRMAPVDVIRHDVVTRIVEAYGAWEEKKKKEKEQRDKQREVRAK